MYFNIYYNKKGSLEIQQSLFYGIVAKKNHFQNCIPFNGLWNQPSWPKR